MGNAVSFLLNGDLVTIDDPSPDLLLIDFLRSPQVALTGAKKGCGQGGCGACTVILSSFGPGSARTEHRAINSCLRPVCALGGLAVTTIEGTGGPVRVAPAHLSHQTQFSRAAAPPDYAPPAVVRASAQSAAARSAALRAALSGEPPPGADEREAMNQVAFRLAINNGTQCGYCTTGFVMNMSALLVTNPSPTKREIEDVFDGNICRCTGYRSILTGMKTFASDWTEEDESNRMDCRGEAAFLTQVRPTPMRIDLPSEPRAQAVEVRHAGKTWLTPTTMDDLLAIVARHRADRLRLILANTSFGIYPDEFLAAEVLVEIGLVDELHGVHVEAGGLHVGAATTYSELIEALDALDAAREDSSCLAAARFMARRTAGTIVRNAGSLAGNTMLVLAHIHAGTGAPFPSDLLTALTAIGAQIGFVRASTGERAQLPVDELIAAVLDEPSLPRDLVLTGYRLPFGDAGDVVMAQKVALREVNAHSIVNATTRLRVADDLRVDAAVIVFGGIAPYPWRPLRTEQALTGEPLSLEQFARLADILRSEVEEELDRWRARMAPEPAEAITDAYRAELAVAFLYKALVNALLRCAPRSVAPAIASSGEITWGRWPVSDGVQRYETQAWKAPVSVPYVKVLALYQATGRVHYTHETTVPPTAVNASFVQSRQALADYFWKLPDAGDPVTPDDVVAHLRERFGSAVDLVTHADVPPHGINMQGMAGDQPLFAIDQISYVGQAIALVIAVTEQEAIEVAQYASEACVGYRPLEWPAPWNTAPFNQAPWNEPVLTLDQAIAMNSVFPDYPASAAFVSHVWRITRPGSRLDWVMPKDPLDERVAVHGGDVDGLPCTIVESTQRCGGQAHFYMETQACVAIPQDGDRLLIHPSTQSPMEMHQTSAMALGVQYHKLEVDVLQVGGGYGGKTEPARFVTGPAVVAAHHLRKPVRLAMKREQDTAMIGKRHAYYGQYQIAVDPGRERPADRGRIRGMHCRMWGDGGAFYDCSFIVSNCIQLRADNAYHVANFQNQIDVCRTNTAPNTAMRAFGDIQGKLLTENAIDDAAFAIGMSAEEVREKNFYDRGDVTPFGQALSYCYMKDVWAYLKEKSHYDVVKVEVDEFNAANTWTKRGIAMVPVKYGSGYNFLQLEQAAAHVVVNSGDGSVIVHQGGVEMGQGVITIVEQVASYVLNVPMDLLHVEFPNTSVLPNPTSTGASTGTSYSAAAVKGACEQLRERLLEFGYRMLAQNGPKSCADSGIDFWNHGEKGWASEVTTAAGTRLIWQNLVQQAYAQRVSLIGSFTAPISGGETPVPAMTFKPLDEQPAIPGVAIAEDPPLGGAVDSFTGFTYSAACSVVELDVLTGEVKLLSSDLVYDMGWSLNPAIDIGQVEGAFVQGIGYVLTEELVYEPAGEQRGRLNTLNTWTYKPPATVTIPLRLNTYLFPRDLAGDVPENPAELFSSKEVGEPPLVLASTVFFAVKYAVRASRVQRGLDGLFRMDAPATVQEVRRACEVSSAEMAGA